MQDTIAVKIIASYTAQIRPNPFRENARLENVCRARRRRQVARAFRRCEASRASQYPGA